MWTCPRCNEPNEPQFTACWKCATVDEESVRRAAQEPRERPNAEWPAIFGEGLVVQPAPEEPVVEVDAHDHVRCPTCGDVFKVRRKEPERG